ncbi:MAG TPA: beta-ketoacyl synthase N-terminal-like domain-containing protein [Fibrobacteria bacterium]|nr:beta-ketoacyl synthase N-terminal-like domain-containing protein [Fibrobacteria bacterium]
MKRIPAFVAITGLGLEIPGLESAPAAWQGAGPAPAPAEFNPEPKLGKKGLLYKDRATKLALCAAKAALEDAGLPATPVGQADPERFGVVVSSNFGNLDTVCRVAEIIRGKGVAETSSMDLPNASSNVIATTLSIRFGLKSLNLMICNGATSGTDALYVAANAIRAGRATRMLVVGVETDNAVVAKLLADSGESPGGPRILDGAGAVVLESREAARERGAKPRAFIGDYAHGDSFATGPVPELVQANAGPASAWFTPNRALEPARGRVNEALDGWSAGDGSRLRDVSAQLGECYGALGVLQCIAACSWLAAHPAGYALATSGGVWGDDTFSSLGILARAD